MGDNSSNRFKLAAESHALLIWLFIAIVALSSRTAGGDTIGAFLRNTDWLVDSSDIVLIGEKVDESHTKVLALLKSPEKNLISHSVGKQILVRAHVFGADLTTGSGRRRSYDSKRAVNDEYDDSKEFEIGERGMFFLRLNRKGQTYLSKRISLDKPIAIAMDYPGRNEIIKFYGVDDGRPLKSAVELLQVTVDRIRLGPTTSLNIDRENVEVTDKLRPFSWRPVGAKWKSSTSILSQNDWWFSFCSPIEERLWDETIPKKQAESGK